MTSNQRDNCSFCLGQIVLPSNTLRSSKSRQGQLWNYLYHQNVQETISSAVEHQQSEPKLTFILANAAVENTNSVGTSDPTNICSDCCIELDKLDKLHEQLESLKKMINDQVQKINFRRNKSFQDDTHLANYVPKLQMAIGGSVSGKESIKQALHFLGNLCDGISTSAKPADSPVTQDGAEATTSEMILNSEHDPEYFDPCQEAEVDPIMKVEIEESQPIIAIKSEPIVVEVDHFYSAPEHSQNLMNNSIDEGYVLMDQFPSISLPTQSSHHDPLAIFGGESSQETGERVNASLPGGGQAKRNSNYVKVTVKSCRICGADIEKGTMARHMKIHLTGKLYRCEFCAKTFTKKDNLIRHRRFHTGEKPFGCDLCAERFARKDALKEHRTKVHRKR